MENSFRFFPLWKRGMKGDLTAFQKAKLLQKFYLPGSFLAEFSKVFKKKIWEDRGILGIAQLRGEEDGRCILETTGKRNPGHERGHGNHDG
jgi:hypothetical protein